MVAMVLGFGGRLGRLRYFLWSLGLAAVLTALTMVLAMGAMGGGTDGGEESVLGVVLVVAPLAIWGNAALMAKRFRDIGWPPLWVLPGWVCFGIIDAWVAMEMPALTAGDNGQTVVGMLVELGLILSLLFWPGRLEEDDYEPLDVEATRASYREAHLRRRLS